jgi:hypothetical protein
MIFKKQWQRITACSVLLAALGLPAANAVCDNSCNVGTGFCVYSTNIKPYYTTCCKNYYKNNCTVYTNAVYAKDINKNCATFFNYCYVVDCTPTGVKC